MEDVIEERAITKICGYVLCQKPLAAITNQRYHISLRDKKVYDITKRKNFCSSGCFGASNYLLEQMLESPLWLRDKEEIPKFRIFSKDAPKNIPPHGEEVDIAIIEHCKKDEAENGRDAKQNSTRGESTDASSQDEEGEIPHQETVESMITGDIKDFVLETIKNMNIKGVDSLGKPGISTPTEKSDEPKVKTAAQSMEKSSQDDSKKQGKADAIEHSVKQVEDKTNEPHTVTMNQDQNNAIYDDDDDDDDFVIEQRVYTMDYLENKVHSDEEDSIEQRSYAVKEDEKENKVDDIIEQNVEKFGTKTNCESIVREKDVSERVAKTTSTPCSAKVVENNVCKDANKTLPKNLSEIATKTISIPCSAKIVENNVCRDANKLKDDSMSKNVSGSATKAISTPYSDIVVERDVSNKLKNHSMPIKVEDETSIDHESVKSKTSIFKKKKRTERKAVIDVNLAAKVEESFQQWVTEDTVHFLFGDDSVKQQAIQKIEQQDKYSILCAKLDRLQFEDEQEDTEILEKPALKPLPHFSVLQEEGKNLELKVEF